jgi:hypothetical protein
MSTLKRKNENGVWEYIQLTGQDVSTLQSSLAAKADKTEAQLFKLTTDTGFSNRIASGTTLITSITKLGEYYITTADSAIITDHPAPNVAGWKLKVDTNHDGTMFIYTLIKNTTVEDRFQMFCRAVRPGTITDTGWRLIQTDAEKHRWYLEDSLKAMYQKVVDLQTLTSKSIGFISDTHYIKDGTGFYGMNGRRTLYNFAKFSQMGLLDLSVHGGDMVNGETMDYKNELNEVLQVFNTVKGTKCILQGNHDYGGNVNHQSSTPNIANELTPLQWYNRMIRPFKNDFVYDPANPTGGYFYKDFDDVKLRVIFLNTADVPNTADANGVPTYDKLMVHGIRNAQLNWLANVALNFTTKSSPTGWNVITFSHVPLANSSTDYNTACNNGVIAHRIIKTFKNGTSYSPVATTGDWGFNVSTNFSSGNGGNHVCHVSGHVHKDANFVYDTLNYMTVLLGATADLSTGKTTDIRPRTPNTVLEDSWSVLTVDTATRKLFVTRFGQGDDNIVINY